MRWIVQTWINSTQIVEVTAKKYEFTPASAGSKLGAKVQLKITSLDKTHGFQDSKGQLVVDP